MKLTKPEAVKFVSDVLGLSSHLLDLPENSLELLNEVVKAYHATIPFQNVDLLCMDENNRRLPTWEQMKVSVMERRGGLCYSVAVFMKYLLEALGYDTFFAASKIFFPDNHVAVVVKDVVSPGSMHLVDFGHPTFEAIPLDFHKESPIYNHSYLEYKFIREDNILLRFHRRGENRPVMAGRELVRDGWRRVVEINLTPRDLSFFDTPMRKAITTADATPFMSTFRAVVCTDFKTIAIKNKSLLLEQSDHSLQETKLETHDDMMTAIQTYFPQFRTGDVEKALDKLRLYH